VAALRRNSTARFTIGSTSDTSDEDSVDDSDEEDLKKLFYPLSDCNGSPFTIGE
jgi:hypothetical protein